MDTVTIEADGWRIMVYREGGMEFYRFAKEWGGRWLLTTRNPPVSLLNLALLVRREAFPGIRLPDLTAAEVLA